MKRLSLRDFASSGHVSTLAIAKVRQNAFCCLILLFQRTRARQKLTGSLLSKSRYSTDVRARLARREKSFVKNFSDSKKERSFDLLSFEGKRIDVGAIKPKLRRFEIRAFCDKMRSFCTISRSTFWKIQPEDGNETLIFKRFRLFWSRFDSSDCEGPSKCFLLSNFDIPAY